jgi:hypothetical protein
MSSLYLELTQITDEVKPIYIHKKYTKLKQFESQIINFHPAVSPVIMLLFFTNDFYQTIYEFMGLFLKIQIPKNP